MNTKLEQLQLDEKARADIPLGFRVIYYKEIPKGVSQDQNLRNRRFESLDVQCPRCEKPVSKLGLSMPWIDI